MNRRPQRQPHDFTLLYLFSYDAEVVRNPTLLSSEIGQFRSFFVTGTFSNLYNVYGDVTTPGLGYQAITGRLDWGNDQALIGNDDIARGDIRATIVTDDHATIDLRYRIVGYLGAGGGRRLIDGQKNDQFGNEDYPFEAPFTTSPRFETADPKYRWLNELQGIGFGKFQLIRNEFRRVTCDVYALT